MNLDTVNVTASWLKIDIGNKPPATCAKRQCPYLETGNTGVCSPSTIFYSSETKKCHGIQTSCGNGKYYAFVLGSWVSRCVQFDYGAGCGGAINFVQPTDCRGSEIYSKLLNKCMKPFKRGRVVG